MSDKDWVDYALAIIQALSLLALVIYVIKTWDMASATREANRIAMEQLQELKQAREEEQAPYVVVQFEIPYGEPWIFLVIRNVGKTVAQDVTMEFDPPLERSDFDPIARIPSEGPSAGSIAPGTELRFFFDSIFDYMGHQEFTSAHKVTSSYSAAMGGVHKRTIQYIDLSLYKDAAWTEVNTLNDVVKSIDKIASETEKVGTSLRNIEADMARGLWIKGAGAVRPDPDIAPERWSDVVLKELSRLELLWGDLFTNEDEFNTHHFDDLRAESLLIRSQLVVALSCAPDAISAEQLGTISKTISNLSKLNNHRLLAIARGERTKPTTYGQELLDLVKASKGSLQATQSAVLTRELA